MARRGVVTEACLHKYGRLTVLSRIPSKPVPKARCRCDCGKVVVINNIYNIISGATKSCGCLKSETVVRRNKSRKGFRKHLNPLFIGKQYHRLTIIAEVTNRPSGSIRVLCRCECGKQKSLPLGNIIRGEVKSCGCLQRDVVRKRSQTHGMSKTPEYQIWKDLRRRCQNNGRADYARYGGRGITVCKRWLQSFENFILDMGSRPSSSHTIERTNNSYGYSPKNCKWATDAEQRNNKRNNRRYTIKGETKTLTQWCRKYNIVYRLVQERIDKLGWDVLTALTKSVRR